MAIKDGSDGRRRSVKTPDEEKQEILEDWSRLTRAEQKVILDSLAQIQRGERPQVIEAANKVDFDFRLPPPREFFTDPDYVGDLATKLYPRRLDDLCEIFEGGYEEVILSGALGIGKSTAGRLLLARMVAEALTYSSPQEAFGLPRSTALHYVNISITIEIARKVLFENMLDFFENAPFFKDMGFKPTKEGIKFPKNVIIAPGASSPRGFIGLTVGGALFDEADFFGDVKGGNKREMRHGIVKDPAAIVHNAMTLRMRSRFAKAGRLPGLFVILSSKREASDFTERRIVQAKDNPKIFYRENSLWDLNREDYPEEEFQVLVGNATTRSRILKPGEAAPEGSRVVNVPVNFRGDFESDIDQALRDLAGVSTSTIEPFIAARERVAEMVDNRFKHPLLTETWTPGQMLQIEWSRLATRGLGNRWAPICCPDAVRHVHVDGSLTECPTGFCMGHVCATKVIRTRTIADDGTTDVIEQVMPLIRLDISLQIPPPQGEEIILSEVSALIPLLLKYGFRILSASCDVYNSAAILQPLKDQMETFQISVEKPGPYVVFKQAIYDGRVKCPNYPPLLNEIRGLEWNHKTMKVAKPPGGLKDTVDAAAAVVYALSNKIDVQTVASEGPSPGVFEPQSPAENHQVFTGKLWDDEVTPEAQAEIDSDYLPFDMG